MLYPVELRADCRTNPGRGGEIRTPDILVPNQARYQATLHPEELRILRGRVEKVNSYL